jgi:hypothetical protein
MKIIISIDTVFDKDYNPRGENIALVNRLMAQGHYISYKAGDDLPLHILVTYFEASGIKYNNIFIDMKQYDLIVDENAKTIQDLRLLL